MVLRDDGADLPELTPAPAGTPGGGLAIGLTEQNPVLLWSAAGGPELPAPFAGWRDRVAALRPALHRVLVNWAELQPLPDRPPDWDRPVDGCMRGAPPCLASRGLRDLLRAIASRQRAGTGPRDVMVSLFGVPEWAAAPASGCERADALPRSRPITEPGLAGYRALVRSLAALGAQEGVELRWWSAWNEPNAQFFVSPQRATCDRASPALSPAVYVPLARALREELERAPGEQRIVLGELAGFDGPRARGASISEFYAALPDDVVCAAAVVAQHAYAEPGDADSATGPVLELERALAPRPCAAALPIWVTETGVGGPQVGGPRAGDDAAERAGCRALDAALRVWHADPRVDLAVQYTVRDDPAYPVGLADPALARAWPSYELWRAWGRDRERTAPAPPLPTACAEG